MAELAGPVGPTTKKDRYSSLDIIRGVALFGILLMNITMFGLPFSYSDPTVYGGAEGKDLWSWIIITMGFEGTQRGMFSILFGAGIILLTSRLEQSGKPGVVDIYFRRNLWLILFGVIHAYILLWSGEILFYYGVCALILFGFRHLKAKNLIALGLIGMLLGAAWNGWDAHAGYDTHLKAEAAQAAKDAGQALSPAQEADLAAWNEMVGYYKPDEAAIQGKIDAYKSDYLTLMLHLAPENARHESWWLYRFFFDFVSMMLIGMGLFKTGFLTLKSSTKNYLLMMVGGYTVGLATNYWEVETLLAANFSVLAFLETNISYDLGRLGMTFGHVGFLLLFVKSGILGWLQKSLAAVGQMALTNYVSHSIICAFVFYGFGFGLYGELARHELYYVVFSIWVVQLVLSPIWLKYYKFGPLEWGWRSLTYLKKQPMRR
jgi:uncharacterized protein